MGWGQRHAPRQGDMGAGVLSTSQRLTAQAEVNRTAAELADAVAAYLDGPQTMSRTASAARREAMSDALDAYREAVGVLTERRVK